MNNSMANEIISYREMCNREGSSLQRGMNFNLGGNHSVILMSVRHNAPYQDRLEENGEVLIYEGHDVPRTSRTVEPKRIDQEDTTARGSLTENGKFYQSAQSFNKGEKPPERVRVYEKIGTGIWSYNGVFHLIDSWKERDQHRMVFKFKLVAVEDEDLSKPVKLNLEHRRIIPTALKLEVWKRDQGKCVKCQATDELHFDHILPYSKGGTSMTTENVQLLCARHNLEKRDKID
jgi:hypothetical protein